MLRFSANLHFLFPEHPFLARFAAARAAGFAAVEFPAPYDDLPAIAAELARHELECVLFNLPMGEAKRGEKGLACLPDRAPEFEAGVVRAIAVARRLGCPRANCMAGVVPPGTDAAACRATLVRNLRHAAHAFADAGLTLCLEALNTHDVPGYAISSVDAALALIAEVGADNLRLQFDAYHMHVMEPDVLAALDRALPFIEHVQFADHPGRHEPGTGTVPIAELFARLRAAGYRGWVGAEYIPTRATIDTLTWRPD